MKLPDTYSSNQKNEVLLVICVSFLPYSYRMICLSIVACSQSCPKEGPYPETPAGEFAYAYCDEGEWGVRAKYCTYSSKPIWIDHEDICKPSKQLIHPPYGSNMVDYTMKVASVFLCEFLD